MTAAYPAPACAIRAAWQRRHPDATAAMLADLAVNTRVQIVATTLSAGGDMADVDSAMEQAAQWIVCAPERPSPTEIAHRALRAVEVAKTLRRVTDACRAQCEDVA